MRFKKIIAYLLIVALVAVNPGIGFTESAAESTTWEGSVDTNWHTEGNWNGGMPQSQADVIIPDTAVSPLLVIDGGALPGGQAAVYNFTATYSGIGLTIQLINNPTIVVGRDFSATNVTFNGAGTILVGDRGSTPYAGSAILTNVQMAQGITLNTSGDIQLVNSTVGTIDSTGSLTMTNSTVNTINNIKNASLDHSDITYRAFNVSGDLTMANDSSVGTIDHVTGMATVTTGNITSLFDVDGALTLATGAEVSMTNAGTIGGALTMTDQSLLNGRITAIGGDVSVDHSTIQFDQAPYYNTSISGNMNLTQGNIINNQSYISMTGSLGMTEGSIFENKVSANITGTTQVDATSHYKNIAATGSFNGAVDVVTGGNFTLTGYNYLTFQNGFINLGTLNFDSTNRISASNGVLKLNNATEMNVDYLNTNNVTVTDSKLAFNRSDGAGFTHTGTLALVNSTLDATKLRLNQMTISAHTITVDGTSSYTFEALGKFSDGSGVKLNTITAGTNLYVTVEDMNRNLSSAVDTVSVTVVSETGDSETLTLTETGASTGVFRNLVALPVVIAAGNASGNNTLGISQTDENITGNYVDGSETLAIKMFKPFVVWDGSVSSDWYTTGNWIGGRVPNATDNVRITGTQGPYVNTSLELLALETASDFTGSAQFYGSTTQFESLKVLGGSMNTSTNLTITGDVTITDADSVTLYGYNGSEIGGNIVVNGVENNFYLQSNSNKMTVTGTTSIQNVLGTVYANNIEFTGTVMSQLNGSSRLEYITAHETVQQLNNTNARSYDSTFEKNVTYDGNDDVDLDYDQYQMALEIKNAETVSLYDLSVLGAFATSAIDSFNSDYSDFMATTLLSKNASIYDNYFAAALNINTVETLNTSSNEFKLAPIQISADTVEINGSDAFYDDATVTGTTAIHFNGSANVSSNSVRETVFRDGTVTFVGPITSEPSMAIRLYDAQLDFPNGTVIPEMIKLWSDGVSSLKNVQITMPRDEYASFSNSGTLTLNNATVDAKQLMLADISQSGTISKTNGGQYLTQGQGYFGDASGNQTDALASGDLWFYMVDHDQNITDSKDTISVDIANTGGVIRTVTLTETETNSGIFANSIASGDVSDSLKVTYEGRTILYKRPAMTWTGLGGDNKWYTKTNWNENIVPLEFDSVQLSGTSDDIDMNEVTEVKNLTMSQTYTGTVTRTEGSLKTKDFRVLGGTFDDNEQRNHTVTVLGNLTVDGGDITNQRNASWTVEGDVIVQNESAVSIYNMTAKSDVTVTLAQLIVPQALYVSGRLTVDGTMNIGTLRVYNTGDMFQNSGTLQVGSFYNDSTFMMTNGKINATYHSQVGNMTQVAGEVTVSGNANFAQASTFNLKSGKYLLTNWGNIGSFGKITMDGGLLDAYGYGVYYGDITVNSGKLKITSKGANDTTLYGDITIGDYGIVSFGSDSSWSRYNLAGTLRSSGNYTFGNQTYLVLLNGADIDLQGKKLEVYSLVLQGGAQTAVQNGTLKIQNRVNSVFNSGGNSVLTLTNATLDAMNAYQYTFNGRTVLDETSRFARKSTGLNIIDQNGNVAPHLFTFGNTMYVLVEDQGANQNSAVVETVSLQYKNITSGEIETLTLTEENANSKRFKGFITSSAIDFGTVASQADVAEGSNGRGTNKVLNFKDQIILKYTDTRTELGLDIFEVAYNGAKLALGSTDIDVSGTGLDFGIAYVDEYAVDQIVLINRGDVTLEISEATILGDTENNFKFAGNGDARTLTGGTIKVAPKSQVNLGLVFEASTPGVKTGTIKLKSNDIETPELTLSLTGIAGYRPSVIESKVNLAYYSGTVGAAGQLGERTVNLSEFFVGRNNQDPLSIRISGNSNTSLFDVFNFNSTTKILTYKIKESGGIAPAGMATITVEAVDTLGFKAETAFGLHVYESNNAELLKLNLLDETNVPIGTWDSVFDAETLTYNISVPVTCDVAKIVANSVSPNAEVAISNTDVGTGLTVLGFGNNSRTVTVTSEDETTTKTYTLVINRPNATLTGTGNNPLVFEAGKATNHIAIDESMRINGAEKVVVSFNTLGFVQTQDKLLYTVPENSPVTATYDAALGKLTLIGSASATEQDYNEILKTVRYQNTGTPATAGNRTVKYALYFGDMDTPVTTQTRTISVNNSPVAKDQTFVHVIESGNLVKALNTSDADGDALTFEIVTPPIKELDGTIAVNNLNFTYAPKGGEEGLDSFVYRVFDGKSYSDYATVTVNLVHQGEEGQPPLVIEAEVEAGSYHENLIEAFGTQTLTADVTKFFEGQNNADPLTYKLVFNTNESLFESASFDVNTGIFSYVLKKTETVAEKGQALITFEAMDSMGYAAEATMVVEVTDAIAITYKVGDSAASVTGNLKLPLTAPTIDTLTWTSSRPDIISDTGVVTRPVKDTVVKLTVAIETNGFIKWQVFYLTVKGTSQLDKVADKTAVSVGYASGEDASAVKSNVFLTKSGSTGCQVVWASSSPQVISATGKVQRPGPEDADVNVTLTATITDPDNLPAVTQSFVLTVKKLTDKEAAEEAARKMTIADAATFAQGDIWESVTEQFLLLQSGIHNTQITWTSSDADVVTLSEEAGQLKATVTRGTKDANILLTATFTKGTETATKSFLVIVKATGVTKDPDEVRVDSTRTATLEQTQGGIENTNDTVIYRTQLSNGILIDTIIVDEAQLQTLIENIDPNDPVLENRTVNITMDAPANDAPDEIAVELQADAVYAVANRNAQLQISTPLADIILDEASLKQVSEEGTDLYFRIRPISDADEQNGLKLSVLSDAAVKTALPNGKKAEAISTPLKIETNLDAVTTIIRIPLTEIASSIPMDTVEARDAFLATLAIYVQHSDGENKVYVPTVVYDNDGNPIALSFTIDKFSAFQIYKTVAAASSSDEGGTPTVVIKTVKGTESIPFETLEKAIIDKKPVTVTIGGITVQIPVDAIDLEALKKSFGDVDTSEISIVVDVASVDKTTQDAIAKAANAQGATLLSTGYSIRIEANYDGKSKPLTLNKPLQITFTDRLGKITTGVLFKNDKIYHQPTFITVNGDVYSGKINTFETGIFAFVYKQMTFSDVLIHWVKGIVENQAGRLVATGSEGLYQPNRAIDRAEFVTLMVKILGFAPKSYDLTFADVTFDAWYNESIQTALSMDLASGYDDGLFKPERTISREEAMAMVSRAMVRMTYAETLTQAEASDSLNGFKDGSTVQSWAKPYVLDNLAKGTISGKNGMLDPKSKITRAEAIALLQNMLQKANMIN